MRLFSLPDSIRAAVALLLVSSPFAIAYTTLSDASLKALPTYPQDLDIKTGSILAPILRPRVPGTPEIEEVRQHFVNFFHQHLPAWRIELQNSTQSTALKRDITFVNIIATRDPPWAHGGDVGRLALVAHYDSKITPQGFIGATDSAVPCAAIMAAARSIDAALTRKWADMQAKGKTNGIDEEEKGVQILLLDGEEAFISWTHTDSLYGARALAQDWDDSANPAMSTFHNRIDQISLFVLLDLLGTYDPSIPSYFQTTHWAFKNMGELERRLRRQKLFRTSEVYPNAALWFKDREMNKMAAEAAGDPQVYWMGGGVEDDHIPFLARGVEVLHLIPSPFPRVWHTINDDGDHCDQATIEDWATLTSAFAAEWMNLEGYIQPPAIAGSARDTDAEPLVMRDTNGYISRSELFGGK